MKNEVKLFEEVSCKSLKKLIARDGCFWLITKIKKSSWTTIIQKIFEANSSFHVK